MPIWIHIYRKSGASTTGTYVAPEISLLACGRCGQHERAAQDRGFRMPSTKHAALQIEFLRN
jgi:hypothetical protein